MQLDFTQVEVFFLFMHSLLVLAQGSLGRSIMKYQPLPAQCILLCKPLCKQLLLKTCIKVFIVIRMVERDPYKMQELQDRKLLISLSQPRKNIKNISFLSHQLGWGNMRVSGLLFLSYAPCPALPSWQKEGWFPELKHQGSLQQHSANGETMLPNALLMTPCPWIPCAVYSHMRNGRNGLYSHMCNDHRVVVAQCLKMLCLSTFRSVGWQF